MKDTFKIRRATIEDAQALVSIYKPIVKETAISFELEIPSVKEMETRIQKIQESHVWFVAVYGDTIIGYAYGGEHRSRKAYQWTTETTVYMHPAYKGRGVARILYEITIKILELQGYTKALGIITDPNPASIKLHSKLGFTKIASFPNIGYKFNRWHSTVWYEKNFGSLKASSQPQICTFDNIQDHSLVKAMLSKSYEFKT